MRVLSVDTKKKSILKKTVLNLEKIKRHHVREIISKRAEKNMIHILKLV